MPYQLDSNIQTLLVTIIILIVKIPQVWNGFACLSNPCYHGICMDDLNSTYFCYCIDGYTGVQCQTNWNECWSNPCQNGGSCIDGIAKFSCSCSSGFVGDLCEENFNECESNPCYNNGTCVDGNNGYSCNCPVGYSGIHCEIDVAVCNTTNETRCENGGICIEGPGTSFSCKCQPGWRGFFCETEINECLSTPCQNGAMCIDLIADYSCACLFGYTGHNCEEIVEICQYNSCKNGALCLQDGTGKDFKCYCVPDYHGDLCQYQYNECQMNHRCLNGGTCIDGVDNFTCLCPPYLTGIFCECLILSNNHLDCNYIETTSLTYKTQVPNKFITTISTLSTYSITNDTETNTIKTTTPIDIQTTFIEKFNNDNEVTIISTEKPFITMTEMFTKSSTPSPEIMTTDKIETNMILEKTSEVSSFFEETTQDILTTSTTTTTTTTTSPEIIQTPPLTTEISTQSWTVFLQQTTEPDIISTTHPTFIINERISSTIMETSTMETSTFLNEKPTTDELTTIRFDCTLQNQCQNGGTCMYSLEFGFKCVCPFDSEGEFCEKQLGFQKAAFSGESILIHKVFFTNQISLEFEANTLALNGLLFYFNVDSSYMALFLEDGYLNFQFSCGYQTMLLKELKVPINNGYTILVEAALEFNISQKHCYAYINVNNSLLMTGDQITIFENFYQKTAYLYLGKSPKNSQLSKSGFIGCLSKLKIFGKQLNIFKDATDGSKINECISLACLLNPCLNGAICSSIDSSKWKCTCQNGYLGERCEISICDNNPCLFGATCIPYSGSGYICLCPYGKHGRLCENDLKISSPYFSSSIQGISSYVAYPIPKGISKRMELKFRIKITTIDQISILLFLGQQGVHDYHSDHLAVSFVKGYIMFTWNLGSGPRRIFTSQPIANTSMSYSIQVGFNGKHGWLFVETLGNYSGKSPGHLIQLDVLPVLFIGGHNSKNFSDLPHDLPLHSGFSGCIYDLQLIYDSLVLPLHGSKGTFGRAVGQCETSECYENSCQNGGACLHHSSTFICICQDSWFGPFCTSSLNPCDFSNHHCSQGSTCVPLINGYECDCPFGKTGRFCESEDKFITDIGLTGKRSFISLESLNLDTSLFDIELEIRPLADNGLVYFSMEKVTKNLIYLYLQSSLLELYILPDKSLIVGSNDLLMITNSKILNIGIWYKIKFGVFGKKAYLSVDNSSNTGILSINYGKAYIQNIFLGGKPDMSSLSEILNLPVPFKGCLRQLFINNKQIRMKKSQIISRNLLDCDGTPCGKDYCQNGGTCWLDSFTKPHCTCLKENFGENCEFFIECNEKNCRKGKCLKKKCVLCLNGWVGQFCENTIQIKQPQFFGNSFIVIEKVNDLKLKRNIQNYEQIERLFINFTTAKVDGGLLLWSRNNGNFFGLGIENGLLKFVYSIIDDKKFFDIRIQPEIADGLWHTININFQPFQIILDNILLHHPDKNIKLFTKGKFYIGGVPNESQIQNETFNLFGKSFEGCIDSISIDPNEMIQDFTQFYGENVDICNIL